MKLNRKGMTLVEIIISVGLIAIVMVFLFRILVDIRHESTMSSTNTKDMVNRTEIISKIQDKIIDDTLTHIQVNNTNTTATITLKVRNDSGDDLNYPITIQNKRLIFQDQTWELQDANAEYDLCHIKTEVIGKDTHPNSHFYVKLLIPVKLKNRDDHSSYDIEISYIGQKHIGFNPSNYQSGQSC